MVTGSVKEDPCWEYIFVTFSKFYMESTLGGTILLTWH